jgi:WD40 repeat protein
VSGAAQRHGAHRARRWCRTALAALALLASGGLAAAAEPAARQVPLPPGLASVWRVDGRNVDSHAGAWSLAAFSTDGKLVGISDDGGTRVYRAADGQLVRMFPAPFSTGQFAYSLALSSTGLVAMGRVGGVEIHALDAPSEPRKLYCGGVCGPVTALAFSPDGAWLAAQAAHSTREVTPGLVSVVDVASGVRSAQLEASSTRTGVLFASGGRSLIAANVTRIDGTGTFGMRRFNAAANWRRTHDLVGAEVPSGSIGPFAFDERVAAYAFEGHVELRDIATGALRWAQPFVPPALDSTAADVAMGLELVAFARDSELLLTYESPLAGDGPGAIVLRRMADGSAVAMYDVVGVSALAFAPDGGSFVYSTGAGRTYSVLARVPR